MEIADAGVSGQKQRSAFVKTLIVLNIFTGIIVIISIAIIIRFAAIIRENGPTNVCRTAGCVRAASEILEFMDKGVDPCQDFYDFSCGGFINNTLLSDDKTTIDTFSLVRDKTQEQLYKLISSNVTSTDVRAFVLAKNLFQACMNRPTIETLGLQPVVDIHRSMGGWPCVEGDQWDRSFSWNWIDASTKFRKLGFSHSYIFGLDINADMKNSTVRRLAIDQASLGLSRKLLLRGMNETVTKAYYDYMVNTAVLFGGEKSRVEKELLDALNFEIAVANISLPMEERRNSTEMYNPMTLNDIQTKYPYNNWVHYVNQILPANVTVDANETVIVLAPSYFDKLAKLLEATPSRTIANYLMWRITDAASDFLSDNIRQIGLKFSTVATGKKEFPARWKECVATASNKMHIAVGSLYIRNYFKPTAKTAASYMVEGIRREFKMSLKKSTWMDEKTKEAALQKLHAINRYIGYPDEFYDDNKINEFYERVHIDPEKYLASALDISIFLTDYDFEDLRKSINKTDWTSHASATAINAFYSFEENSIELPAAILQGRFFSDDHPRYLNYGAIGFIIGHELTHGFDDEGRQYDLEGNLVDWWHNETVQHFLKRAKCIIEQYGNYTDKNTDLAINGINTQGENIADNGGLKQSYNAYLKWMKDHGTENRLPGLVEYSPQQMFWIASAQTWCSIERSAYTKLRIINGVHALDKYRVIGTLSNSVEFSKDFNCPKNSPMNPVKKCQVW